jgi:hypothetical protein
VGKKMRERNIEQWARELPDNEEVGVFIDDIEVWVVRCSGEVQAA